MEHLLDAITHYGYAGLFAALVFGIVGLPLPDETILVFCGYLIASGRMQAIPAFATAAAGAVCGISCSYLIGRTVGHALIERYGRWIHLTPERMSRVHRWFARVGNWVLTFGYFILGLRHVTALAAGMSELEFPVFARFAWTGAVLWVGTFLTIGYLVGENWRAAIVFVHRYTLVAGIAATIACAGFYVYFRARARRSARSV